MEGLPGVAGPPRSTFFHHQSRLNGPDPWASLKAAVTEIFKKNHSRYRHRRIHIELLMQGWAVARNTVPKLMPSLRLVCKVRSRKRYNSYQGDQDVVAPNRLKPLVHSNQGFEYQHISWRTPLENVGAIQSRSRKANCYDNAVMKNFFGHLREEFFHRVHSLNTDAPTTALHEYIRWYNTERISTKLKG